MEAGAYSSWRLWGQRQQCSKHCGTQGPSDHRYLTVLAVQRLLGGQQLVRVLCFCLVFCWRASKYFRSTHLPTSGNCHRKDLAINEEQFKCQKPHSLQVRCIFRNSGSNHKMKKSWTLWISQQQDLALLVGGSRNSIPRSRTLARCCLWKD